MRKILMMASVMMLGASGAWAAGTAAGTVVNNSASLSYQVGGTTINTPVNSNTDTFVVDDKVDLTVAHQDPNAVPVTPGAAAQVLEFTVTNTGNKTHDFLLTAGQNDGNPYGETHPDQFDATNVHAYVESGANQGYQPGEDTETYIDELAADASKTVYIVSDIPNPLNNNDVAEMTLTAQVAVGGTAGTQGAAIANDDRNTDDTKGSNQGDEQIVFADAAGVNGAPDIARDGKHGDTSAYKVQTAVLSLNKLSCVISDGFTADNTKAKRIPGATIAYVFDVENTGSADAENVTVSDDLAAELDQGNITVQELESNTGAACTCVNGSGNGTNGTHSVPANSQANHDVEINIGTVNTNNHSCLEIRVPIL